MSAVDPQKKAVVQELLRRRDKLDPKKQAIVDELARRYNLTSDAASTPPVESTPIQRQDERTAAQIRMDQANKAAGAAGLQGLPEMLVGRGSARMQESLKNIGKGAMNLLSTVGANAYQNESGLPPMTPEQTQQVSGAITAPITAPVKAVYNTLTKTAPTVVQGMMALANPDIPAPSREQFESAAENSGALLANAPQIAGMVKGGIAGTKAVSRAFKDPNAADVRALAGPPPQKSVMTMAEVYAAKTSQQAMKQFKDVAETGMNEIIKSSDELFHARPQNNQQQVIAGEHALKRIYADIKKEVQDIPEIDLRPYGEKLKHDIPTHWTDSEKAAAVARIDKQFDRTLTGLDAEKLRQKFAAEARVNLAKNNYERAAVEKTFKGWVTDKQGGMVREAVADAVKNNSGKDIKALLSRYGKTSDLVQRSNGGVPLDPTLVEVASGHTYVTGTKPNVIGRTAQGLAKLVRSNDRLIRQAYADFKGPTKLMGPPNPMIASGKLLGPGLPVPPPGLGDSYVKGIPASQAGPPPPLVPKLSRTTSRPIKN